MNSIWAELGLVLLLVFLAPIVLLFGLCYAIVLVPLSPLVLIGFIIWWKIRNKNPDKPLKLKETKRIYKPITIPWGGRQVPLIPFILSAILSIVLTIVLLFLIIFVIPPFFTVLVLGFMVGARIGKHVKKK